MKRLLIAVMVLALPASAFALNIDQLLATIAMPLATAAVSNVANVPQDQLATFVSALDQANVPPDQFVNVVRYTPVALVDQNGQPFIAYVQQQTSQGVTGNALVDAIVQQLESRYGVTPQMTIQPAYAPTYVVSNDYIPTNVLTPLGTSDPLAAIALPLAVAAVSDMTGVPQDQLTSLVTTLNQANVPVAQEVQVIRYVPVVLVSNNAQPFVQYVQQQVAQGVTGPALVPVITQQLQPYYPAQQVTVAAPAPQPVINETQVVPPVVVSRVEEMRRNPHGGPPGLLKRELGYQTGAEVVHGAPPPIAAAPPMREEHGHGRGHMERENTPMTSAAPPVMEERGHGHGRGHEEQVVAPPVVVAPPPTVVTPVPAAPVARPAGPPPGRGPEGAGPPGQEKGHGGKGHGKD